MSPFLTKGNPASLVSANSAQLPNEARWGLISVKYYPQLLRQVGENTFPQGKNLMLCLSPFAGAKALSRLHFMLKFFPYIAALNCQAEIILSNTE